MKHKQLSVFLKNSKGTLYNLCGLLGKNGINIDAITISENLEFGAVHLVVDKTEEALKILKENNFVVSAIDVVIAEANDKPGALANILKLMYDNSINVDYMYGFAERALKKGLMVFKFDNADKAVEILSKNNVKLLTRKELDGI